MLDINKFTTGKLAVCCENQREFMQLLEIVHEAGICNDDLYENFQIIPLEPSNGYPIYVFYNSIHSLMWASVDYILRSDESRISFAEIEHSCNVNSRELLDLLEK